MPTEPAPRKPAKSQRPRFARPTSNRVPGRPSCAQLQKLESCPPTASADSALNPIDHPPSTIDDPPNPVPTINESVPYFVYSQRYAKPIEWLWPGLIPLGKVTLLIGDPGIGKSLLAVDLAARITCGEGVPPDDEPRPPARVLYLAGDGETEDILPERLLSFGADLNRVAGIDDPDWEERPHSEIKMFSLAHDIDRIHTTLRRWTDCRLIVIDPISAFLDGIDANNNMDVRRLLTRLSTIARRYNAAVLVISHFRKAAAAMLLYRSLGSIAFTLATRVVLTLAADPAVAGRRLLLPAKMNPLPQSHQLGRAFSIGFNRLDWETDPILLPPDQLRDFSLFGMAVDDRVDEVARWLRSELKGQRRPSTELAAAAQKENIPMHVLYAARKRAKVHIVRDGQENRWYWEPGNIDVIQDWQLPAFFNDTPDELL